MATRPISNVINVWNQNTTYTGIGLNITDTQSGTNSKLLNLQINSGSKFYVDKNGNVVATGNISSSKFTASYAHIGGVPSTSQYKFGDNSLPDLYSNKIRGYSGSFTYLEIISGSSPRVKMPFIDTVTDISGKFDNIGNVSQNIRFRNNGGQPVIYIEADDTIGGGAVNIGSPEINVGAVNVSGPNSGRSPIEVDNGAISFNPTDPNDCIDFNGCLNLSGNLFVKGVKVGPNSLFLSSSATESRIHGTNLTISSSVISASRMYVGGVITTHQYKFSNGTKPDLYVEKLRAHSASFTYMEAITGSNPIIKLPGTTSLIVGNPSTRAIVEYNNPTNGAAITIYPALKPNIGIPNQIWANFIIPDEYGIGTNWNYGLVGHKIGSPAQPEWMVDGFGISNELGQYITSGNWKITGDGPLSGGKACIDITAGNFNYSTLIQEFYTPAQMASIPASVKKYLSGSNKLSTEICVTSCSISVDTKFQAGIQSELLGGQIAKIDIVSNSSKVDLCVSGCLVITSDTRVRNMQDTTYRTSTCEDMDNEYGFKLFGNTEMKSRRRKILADNTSSLFIITQETYDLKRNQIKLQITSSSDNNDYAAAAARLNYTLPLPTYQQVSTDIYNPSYSMFPKDFKSDWETLSATDSIFVVNAIDIQSGSLVRGIGPAGNQLEINANEITSNVISSSNFNVSGGMLYIGKITGSSGRIESLTVTSITGSSQITASSAGSSSGKYAKIKIGNQTFKILLYANS